MAGDKKRSNDDTEARSKAQLSDQVDQLEAEAKTRLGQIDQLHTDADTSLAQSEAHLLHELQVHQIELEMQNAELKEAQQRLEETRDRYADLYDFAPIGYLTLDETGRILETNLTGAAMLGEERAHLVGRPFAMCLPAADSQLFFLYLNRVCHSAGSGNIVTETRIQHGELDIRLESAPMPGASGQGRTCRMIMTDISEQKRTATALQQTLSTQEALLKTIPAIAFFKDNNQRFTAVSPAFTEFFGRPAAEILGKTIFDLAPRELAEEIQKNDQSVMFYGQPRKDIEHVAYAAGGNPVFLSASLAPYFGPDGKVAGLVGVFVDVTAIREAEQRSQDLLLQNRQITQRLFNVQEEERRDLARELHDELGQWLTAIHAEAEAICSSSGAEREPEILANAQAIGRSATEVQSVVRRILNRLRPSLLDALGLTESLRELATQWRRHHTHVVCNLELDGDLDTLPELLNITLYRIMQEALTNVANHADASQVRVWLRRVAGEPSTPDHLLLTVEDDGKGMDTLRPAKGMGILGMRERVIAAGGKFVAHSSPDQGVRIEIRLPVTLLTERRKK